VIKRQVVAGIELIPFQIPGWIATVVAASLSGHLKQCKKNETAG